MARVFAVAWDAGEGVWLVGLVEEATAHETPFEVAKWPYERMLTLCMHCDEVHQIFPDQVPADGTCILLAHGMKVVPDTGQKNPLPVMISKGPLPRGVTPVGSLGPHLSRLRDQKQARRRKRRPDA